MRINGRIVKDVYEIMRSGKAKAVTISNVYKHESIVLFNKHRWFEDYLNSLVHEAEHIKQSMLYAYRIEDGGRSTCLYYGVFGRKDVRGIETVVVI